MASLAAPLEQLIEQLGSLPGIGRKSAQRLAFYLLGLPETQAERFLESVRTARETIHECRVCCNLTDGDVCPVCADTTRDLRTICVVSDPRDVLAIERTHEYRGLYHVLYGSISPIDGIGPDQLRIKELLHRVAEQPIEEIIMATNPTVEGEATAMYLGKLLMPFGVKVTRLAYGIPVGGDLDGADEITLRHSLEGRGSLL